jgi:hypothetical protein
LGSHAVITEAFDHHLDGASEVRADAIHLVDEPESGHFVPVGLVPDGFRLGLDARDGIEDGDGPVKHAQGA